MWPIRPGRVGIAGLALHSPFYLALTLMMGVLTDSRGKLLDVSLGVLLGGLLVASLPGRFAMLTPWSLAGALPPAVMGYLYRCPFGCPWPRR